jgi:hypothetical protein
MKVKNRWGTIYPYFYCLGKQEHRTDCTQRMLSIDHVRRLMNQAFFARLLVDDDGVRGELAEPFATLVGMVEEEKRPPNGVMCAERAIRAAGEEPGANKPSRTYVRKGLSIDWLVGEEGLEPSRACAHKILSLACIPISPLAPG